jgi:hypothetical protein
MEWRKIKDASCYFINNSGDIYSTKSKRIMKPSMSGSGYKSIPLRVNNKYKGFFVHRLVAKAFVVNEGDQVNHIDGNKLNNKSDNLEWCNQSANQNHALKTGLRKLKYSRDVVECILIMRSQKVTQKAISEILDIKLSFVKDVSLGRTRIHF